MRDGSVDLKVSVVADLEAAVGVGTGDSCEAHLAGVAAGIGAEVGVMNYVRGAACVVVSCLALVEVVSR